MKTNDYVKYMTQEFVKYMNESKEQRDSEKKAKKEDRSPFVNRWFGVLPMSIQLMMNKTEEENKSKEEETS